MKHISHIIKDNPKYAKLEALMEEYRQFVMEWNKDHSISKAPSFTSWKQYYRNK